MTLVFEFDTDRYELDSVHIARIFLDIQHLAIVTFALAGDKLDADHMVFDEYKRKLKNKVVTIVRVVINNLFFIDLERERRTVAIQLMREQVLEQRIKNVSDALSLAKKIPNGHLREEYLESLRSSVLPFAIEHPPI